VKNGIILGTLLLALMLCVTACGGATQHSFFDMEGTIVCVEHCDSDGFPTLIYLDNRSEPLEVNQNIAQLPVGIPVRLSFMGDGGANLKIIGVEILEEGK
jgi:hypothetical protein